MALSTIANQIRNGEIDCGLAMGIEQLSVPTAPLDTFAEHIMAVPAANDCISWWLCPS